MSCFFQLEFEVGCVISNSFSNSNYVRRLLRTSCTVHTRSVRTVMYPGTVQVPVLYVEVQNIKK